MVDEDWKADMWMMYGIDFDPHNFTIVDSRQYTNEVELPDKLIILCTDHHNSVAMDYRDSANHPSVVYIHEHYGDHSDKHENQKNHTIIQIAPTFDEFLTKLFRLPPIDPKKLSVSYGRKR